MKKIQPSWPFFSLEEREAIKSLLGSGNVNYWTGNEGRQFESEFSTWTGSSYAIALMNGTVALDVALKVLGIGPGDEVVVTPRTFIASVSCVVNAGAIPVFADVELDSGNISARTIAEVLTPKTKAVICVHLAGWPCDMDPIMALAEKHQLKVIEDCAQAHGARYKGRSIGSIGHIGAWSFCQDKIMTTGGEGGMVTTNDESLYRAMWAYKDHGKSYEAVFDREHPPGFRWLHESFGTNWRMLEMQAVIGRIQLTRMAEWTRLRNQNARAIWETAKSLPGIRVPEFGCHSCLGACDAQTGCVHATYKCYVYVEAGAAVRDQLIEQITARGVPCFSGSCSEVYLEKAFDGTGFRPKERLANAKRLGETSLMFLCHPTLTESEIQRTCDALRESVLALADHLPDA
jgi:dTDP-4-amino-4,6-dideoxygalactose transaminase